MKKVCFVQNYSSSAHRGVGFYASRLLDHLRKYAPEYDMALVSDFTTCDLIHYPYFDLFSHTLPLSSAIPRIVSILDVIPLEFPNIYQPGLKGSINLLFQKHALTTTQAIITISNASAAQIQARLDVPKTKIHVTYLAPDPAFKKLTAKPALAKIKTHYRLPDKFILYVGGINYNKNLPTLITACRQAHLPLVIVGKEALEIEKLDMNHPELRHLNNLDLTNVIRLGFVSTEDLVGIYNLASVYCQPSFSEGFGLNVLEALACGTPVAVSNTSSLPEIVGDNGTYFDPHDPTSMALAINQALSAKPKPVDPKFTWENTAKQTLTLYNSLIDN